MAAKCLTTLTEQWIRDKLRLKHIYLGDVSSLALPGTCEEKIRNLGNALVNFRRLKSRDLSCNALVSVKGLQHLKVLQRLILYRNCIPALEDVKELDQLPALIELDLRLNPLTQSHPSYRLHLVHGMPNLRKLGKDGCSVKDTERKVAIMQFSSDLRPQQRSSSDSQPDGQRSIDPRLAAVNRITKRRSLLNDTDDIVLNFVASSLGSRGEAQTFSDSVHKEAKEPRGVESKDFTEQRSSTPKQGTTRSIVRYPLKRYDFKQSSTPHPRIPSHKRKVAGRPMVTFDPYVEEHSPGKQEQKVLPKPSRQAAQGHFTPNPGKNQSFGHSSSFSNVCPPSARRPGLKLSGPSNPILHPPRLTYCSFNKTEGCSGLPREEKRKRGSYRKPLEMLLNLVDKYWTGERSLHRDKNFLSQAVHVLSMMESDVSSQEAEVRTLKRQTDALTFQLAAQDEKNRAELRYVAAQREEARSAAGELNEQLKTVLEENLSLQKQLIRLEGRYLNSMIRSSPVTRIKEVQTEVEGLRREIGELREKVQEPEKGF
ncbi:LOW QUALITY PROTEIN: centrosomal protein of 72 kDa [Brachionichthys hirsutus]|uniref:LOW QUALITY PROTEIN: centrosomal protein of 72 kDa n=1 Tax=Brachionichthys hirsutus TaxID=412623 RepID=UPI0036047E0D